MDATAQLKALLEIEPQLEFEFPQVFVQPKIESFSRGKANIKKLLNTLRKSRKDDNGALFTKAYNDLILEFRPTIEWAKLSWDYLLTTEGMRYLARPEGERMYCHGNYRAFTDRDFSRIIHKVFKECLFSYLGISPFGNESFSNGTGKNNCSFIFYLKKNFWSGTVKVYKELENPSDPNQRKLTAYSYLRCVPYEFLNRYHQEIVDNILTRLTSEEKEIAELHFISFFKEEEILKRRNLTPEDFSKLKEELLAKIFLLDPLVHALLLQIERY